MRDAAVVALNGDRSRETGEGDGPVELRKRVAHGLTEPVTRDDEADDAKKKDEDRQCEEEAATSSLPRSLFWAEGFVGDHVGVRQVGKTHGLDGKCKWCRLMMIDDLDQLSAFDRIGQEVSLARFLK